MFPSRTSEGFPNILCRLYGVTEERKGGRPLPVRDHQLTQGLSEDQLDEKPGLVGAFSHCPRAMLPQGPSSNFCMAHITQSMVSLRERANSAASPITMA